jgi:glutamate/tyrosine decarboxylase-like PLP-dependent enzyme
MDTMKTDAVHTSMRRELAEKKIFERAKAHAFTFMDAVSDRNVVPDEDTIESLSAFDEPLPDSPQSAEHVLDQLNKFGSPNAVAQTGGRYFGFVNGSVVPAALAARWLADTWDQNAALHVISPISSKLEQICERWLVDLLQLPEETVAGYVGGTSAATHCGLAAARYHLLKRLDWDVNIKGLRKAPGLRVVLSEQAHGTVFKALALLGFGRDELELVPSDAQGRIQQKQLPELDPQTLLVLQAGNVNTGAFDAFEPICEKANQAGAWVHIDGAFGLWAEASGKTRHLTRGIRKADSWSVDGHKTLNTPYDCGIVLCRHRDSLVAAMQASGSYIIYSDKRDGMLYVPDMSRRARSIELWATLKYLGRSGVEQLVDGLCEKASLFAEMLGRNGFRILNEVVFNQVLLACDMPDQTQTVLERIQGSGVLWCGGTTWKDEPAIRISVCSWATTSDDVKRCVAEFVKAREVLSD